jgi:hypothetical protein
VTIVSKALLLNVKSITNQESDTLLRVEVIIFDFQGKGALSYNLRGRYTIVAQLSFIWALQASSAHMIDYVSINLAVIVKGGFI